MNASKRNLGVLFFSAFEILKLKSNEMKFVSLILPQYFS